MSTTDDAPARAYDMSRRAEAAEGTGRRIAEAATDLFEAHDYDSVTLAAIARAAGVSHQTVLNHFESKAGVLLASAEVIQERMEAMQVDAVAGDVPSVVHAVCSRYEATGDANARWAAIDSRVPEVGALLDHARDVFQGWLVDWLGELMPPPEDEQEHRRVLLGLHAALDVYTWKLLRRDLGLSQERTEQQMTDLVLGVLARHR